MQYVRRVQQSVLLVGVLCHLLLAIEVASAQPFPPGLGQRVIARAPDAFPVADRVAEGLTRELDAAGKVDWRALRLMSELSFIAYEDSIPAVQNRLKLYGMELSEFITVDNHHFIAAWEPTSGVLIVAFRGTDVSQMADLWADADYTALQVRGGTVHKGFYDAASLLRPFVAASINRHRPRHLWLTGHSLGGAIATLMMDQLEQQRTRVAGVVTFGQPRIGDRAYVEQMNQRLGHRMLRVINEDDIVVSLPPRSWGLLTPSFYSGGSAARFFGDSLERTRVDMMGAASDAPVGGGVETPPTTEFSVDIFPADSPPPDPIGNVPPDPDQLDAQEHQQLKAALDDDGAVGEPPAANNPVGGGFGAGGPSARSFNPLDDLNLKRRAALHSMYRYVQQIERFAAEGK